MGHIFRLQIAAVNRANLAFDAAQIKKQFLLRGGGADFHQRPGAQHIFLNRRLNPPHRIGGQAEAFIRVKFLDRMHHTQIAFGNQICHRQAIAAVSHRNFGHQAQMAGHQLMRRVHITAFSKGPGQHIFLIRFQHRKLADLLHIAGQAALRGQGGNKGVSAHLCLFLLFRVGSYMGVLSVSVKRGRIKAKEGENSTGDGVRPGRGQQSPHLSLPAGRPYPLAGGCQSQGLRRLWGAQKTGGPHAGPGAEKRARWPERPG